MKRAQRAELAEDIDKTTADVNAAVVKLADKIHDTCYADKTRKDAYKRSYQEALYEIGLDWRDGAYSRRDRVWRKAEQVYAEDRCAH